jgi:hypothetical protein
MISMYLVQVDGGGRAWRRAQRVRHVTEVRVGQRRRAVIRRDNVQRVPQRRPNLLVAVNL